MTVQELKKVTLEKLKLIDEVESITINSVLEIIDTLEMNQEAVDDFRDAVLILKGGEQE